MTQEQFKDIHLQQMQVQANLLSTFETAANVLNNMHSTLVLLDFQNTDTLQAFYNSLYYFVDGCQGLQEGFKVLCSSYNLEVVDPID